MYKNFRLFTPVVVILMVLSAVLTFLTLLADPRLFIMCAALCVIVFLVTLLLLQRASGRIATTLDDIEQGILYTGREAFVDTPFPVITVYEGGEIIWYNEPCDKQVFAGESRRGMHISEVFPSLDVSATSSAEGVPVRYGRRDYTAFVAISRRERANVAVVYLVDDTDLKFYTNEYYQSQPSAAIIVIDNYEELGQDYRDTERAQLMSEVEKVIEQYITENHGFITRIERDRYLAVLQERGVVNITERKFDLLDRVRRIHIGNRMNVTISIGLGREASNLYESQSMAGQALDMCLGRGGDQATIRTHNGYEFYGGTSKGIEKRTKVKTRIIASALAELIDGAENVLIMGHRFADLDALGSSVGMLKAVRAMNKPSAICIDREKNLVQPLLERLLNGGYVEEDFLSPQQALSLVTKGTLLIIMDTHVPGVVESEELYRACRNVVVIDHHRKLVGYIDNAVIFYHEPYASSTSEMVSELVQYFPVRPQITKLEAEAMLSGIMLDTKNFIMRTGVRTFEAAAYLRRQGADTIEVRTLFTNSMESYQQKTSLVSGAEIYRGCAIATSDQSYDAIKVIAPQAADELMSISGVEASFVVFLHNGIVNVSARSMGLVNVQVIMESFGGGGHHTMAAAQLEGETVDSVRERVKDAIDRYRQEQREREALEHPVEPMAEIDELHIQQSQP